MASEAKNTEQNPPTETADSHEPIFKPLSADVDVDNVQRVESLCVNCFDQGITSLLLTKIPYFKNVILMSFECEHCGYRTNELQPASEIQAKGCRYRLDVDHKDKEAIHMDLNRQVIKGEWATIYLPDIDFEMGNSSKRGDVITVEGLLMNAADNMEAGQAERREQQPEIAEKLQAIIDRLKRMALGEESFGFILDDITGNSYLENPYAPAADHRVVKSFYTRNKAQNEELDLPEEEAVDIPATASMTYRDKLRYGNGCQIEKKATYFEDVADSAVVLPCQCHECNAACETRMCLTDIPFFKEVIIMVTQCDNCGYKNSEVKPGGGVPDKGCKYTLQVKHADDLLRDVLKTDTAGCTIPELELQLDHGTLGGKYTTVEGLMKDMKNQLETSAVFQSGDSSDEKQRTRMTEFLAKFDELLSGSTPFTFIIDDPMGNCFISSEGDPANDACLTIEHYTRSYEQNEELGLNDINVDNYLPEDQQAVANGENAKEADKEQPAEAST